MLFASDHGRKIILMVFLCLLLAVALLFIFASPVFAQGEAGESVDEAVEGKLDKTDADILWLCIAAFLVFFMQAGFAFVEAGFCRAKNTVNLMMKNLMDFCIGSLGFWIVGFALMFGTSAAGIISIASGHKGGSSTLRHFLLFVCMIMTFRPERSNATLSLAKTSTEPEPPNTNKGIFGGVSRPCSSTFPTIAIWPVTYSCPFHSPAGRP